MKRLCITTVVSNDHYQEFIPAFVYTAKTAYPEAGVMIFVRGPILDNVQHVLITMREQKLCDPNWLIHSRQFAGFPDSPSLCNSLRHLVDPGHFYNYTHVYTTDIDFLIFPHEPTLLEYYDRIMKVTGLPYAAARGPYQKPRRPEVTKEGWVGNFARLASGFVMVRNPEWYNATVSVRKKYLELLRKGEHDQFDLHPAGSYREYDEVMLSRICRQSGLPISGWKNCFSNGHKFNALYRDIHLGDFKFTHRWQNQKKMGRRLMEDNMNVYFELDPDPAWQQIIQDCPRNPAIKDCFTNLRQYMERRRDLRQACSTSS